MSDYNERMPVASLRIEKHLLELIDSIVSNLGDSRQDYIKKLIVNDLTRRGLLAIDYRIKDE